MNYYAKQCSKGHYAIYLDENLTQHAGSVSFWEEDDLLCIGIIEFEKLSEVAHDNILHSGINEKNLTIYNKIDSSVNQNRRYSPHLQSKAVKMVIEQGVSQEMVARRLVIPLEKLAEWVAAVTDSASPSVSMRHSEENIVVEIGST